MKSKILLADDHPPLLEAASTLLKPHFDLVGIVTDGAMLVSEALRLRPDVIVTDINMPVVTGIGAVIQLRKSWPSAKVVFRLTVYSKRSSLRRVWPRAHWDTSSSHLWERI